MPTAENLTAFLKKRGYQAEVIRKPPEGTFPDTYFISLHIKELDDVEALLGSITQAGRFVVTLYHQDIIELLNKELSIGQTATELGELRKDFTEFTEKFAETTQPALSQVEDEVEQLWETIKVNVKDIETLKKPWYKKLVGK